MAVTNNVKFKQGPSSSLPSAIDPGSLLFETDTGNTYLDVDSDTRIQLKDSTKLPTTGGTVSGQITSTVNDGTAPFVIKSKSEVKNLRAEFATKLAIARNITLTGDATGSAAFDGSAEASINVTVNHATSADTATKATTADSATTADTATKANSADSATKATQDSQGNVINETYATKGEIASGVIRWETFGEG